jgi:DNA polymerase III subunit delta
VNVQELLDNPLPDPPAPVYLFCPHKPPRGKNSTFEPLLAERALERMVTALIDEGARDLCYNAYHGDETDPGEIVSVAETFPFLSDRRVIVVHGAQQYETESKGARLHEYIQNPAEFTSLLLVAPRVDRRSKFYKACVKAGTIVECPELREDGVKRWAREEIAKLDKSIDGNALDELVGRTGTHLSDVYNALTLVCGYVGDAPRVAEADVRAACADVAEEEIWALTDAIAASDTNKAMRVLREIIDLGKNEFEILGSINWLLKSAHTVARGGKTPLSISPFVARKVEPLAAKLGHEKLPAAFRLCMETDVLFRSTGVDRALALELLVVKLAAPRRHRPAPAS